MLIIMWIHVVFTISLCIMYFSYAYGLQRTVLSLKLSHSSEAGSSDEGNLHVCEAEADYYVEDTGSGVNRDSLFDSRGECDFEVEELGTSGQPESDENSGELRKEIVCHMQSTYVG